MTARNHAALGVSHQRLLDWAVHAAYPLWSTRGIDTDGSFVETLGPDGREQPQPRRARVQPRQVYAFAQARSLGWVGDAPRIVRAGIDTFCARYQRPDGLFRALVAADGTPLENGAVLYDQAFALLGLASAAVALEARTQFEARALALLERIDAVFGTAGDAYRAREVDTGGFESNPHMHLLEACLAWAEIGNDPRWVRRARALADLAVRRFIRTDSGALGEFFAPDWQPAPGIAGRLIEPGHQFEWAWLLLRVGGEALRQVALRLIAIGERYGTRDGVAVNALLDDFSTHDPNARCWPQTERLKAAVLAATLTDTEGHWRAADAAAQALLGYLATPIRGLWLDVRLPSGVMVDGPAPASTFYHLVGAIVALDKALRPAPP